MAAPTPELPREGHQTSLEGRSAPDGLTALRGDSANPVIYVQDFGGLNSRYFLLVGEE